MQLHAAACMQANHLVFNIIIVYYIFIYILHIHIHITYTFDEYLGHSNRNIC